MCWRSESLHMQFLLCKLIKNHLNKDPRRGAAISFSVLLAALSSSSGAPTGPQELCAELTNASGHQWAGVSNGPARWHLRASPHATASLCSASLTQPKQRRADAVPTDFPSEVVHIWAISVSSLSKCSDVQNSSSTLTAQNAVVFPVSEDFSLASHTDRLLLLEAEKVMREKRKRRLQKFLWTRLFREQRRGGWARWSAA